MVALTCHELSVVPPKMFEARRGRRGGPNVQPGHAVLKRFVAGILLGILFTIRLGGRGALVGRIWSCISRRYYVRGAACMLQDSTAVVSTSHDGQLGRCARLVRKSISKRMESFLAKSDRVSSARNHLPLVTRTETVPGPLTAQCSIVQCSSIDWTP